MPLTLRSALICTAALLTGASGWWFQDKGPNADLREQVCEKFVDMQAMAPSGQSACEDDDDEFRFFLEAAAKSRVSGYRTRLSRDLDVVHSAGLYLDKDDFREISFAEFEDIYDSRPYAGVFSELRNGELNTTSLSVTEVLTRGLFAEASDEPRLQFSPTPDEDSVRFHAEDLPMNPVLATTIDNSFGWECELLEDVDGGCKGRIYLVADDDPDAPNLRVAAFDMEELTDKQMMHILMYLYAPKLREGEFWIKDDANKMRRILANW